MKIMRNLIAPFRAKLRKGLNQCAFRIWYSSPDLLTPVVVNCSARSIPYFAEQLERYGDFERALKLVTTKKLNGARPRTSSTLLGRYLTKLSRFDELKSWYDEHLPQIENTELSNQHTKLRTALFRAEEELGERNLRHSQSVAALAALVGSDEPNTAAAKSLLIANRIFSPIQTGLFVPGTVTDWKSVKGAFTTLSATESIQHWVDIASENELLPPASPKRTISTNDWPSGSFGQIEIFIPNHYFATWDQKNGGARQELWRTIRRMFGSFVSAVDNSGVPVVPRHQYFLNVAAPTRGSPALSFFTANGDPNHWHMRDIGLDNYISIDPDGYWGHSSISRIDISSRLEAMDVTDEQMDEAVEELRSYFSESGGNKYAAVQAAAITSIEQRSIFVPLQAPNGLEATDTSVEDIISLVSKYSSETGVTVYLRRHPLDESPLVDSLIRRALKTSKCVVSETPPWKLTLGSAATVTINSATALQAIAAGKPTFTWGRSDIHSVATDICDYPTFKRNMDAVLSGRQHSTNLQRRFSYFYMRKYLIDVRDPKAVSDRLKLMSDLNSIDSHEEVRQTFIDRIFSA